MRELNTTDFGCVNPGDFDDLCQNPQALVFEKQRLEVELSLAKEHLSKLRGMKIQGPWLGRRITFQEAEVRKYANLLNHVHSLIGEAPRHIAR